MQLSSQIVTSAHALKHFEIVFLTMQIYKLDKPHPAFQNLENGYCRFLNNRCDISTSADISAVFSLILENEYFRFLMH